MERTLEDIQKTIDEGGYNLTRLRKEQPALYSWLYRHGLLNSVSWPAPPARQKVQKPHVWHDITKVLHYLQRWADEEGTTVEHQAYKYDYGPEWEELKKSPSDDGRAAS